MLSTRLRTGRQWFVGLCLAGACVATLVPLGFPAEGPEGPASPESSNSIPSGSTPSDGTPSEGPPSEGSLSPGSPSDGSPSDGSPLETTAAPSNEVNPSIALKGSIWRTKPGIVFLRTPVGLLTLSSKTTLKDLRASQEVTFFVHGADIAVDIRKRADGALVHRYLSGPLKPGDRDGTTMRRWTPEGEKSFDYGTHAQALRARHEGDLVTLEANDTDTILGLRDLQFDLQVGQLPPGDSHTHLLLSGTVSKLKSNFIFFRTPIGIVNVNSKIGIKNVKVGQVMTLHIHDRHVVADLASPQAATPARRFVTGPLQFATSEHSSVTLWTPDGDQTYPTERGKVALTGLKEGHPITVELNSEGGVVAFHRFK